MPWLMMESGKRTSFATRLTYTKPSNRQSYSNYSTSYINRDEEIVDNESSEDEFTTESRQKMSSKLSNATKHMVEQVKYAITTR